MRDCYDYYTNKDGWPASLYDLARERLCLAGFIYDEAQMVWRRGQSWLTTEALLYVTEEKK